MSINSSTPPTIDTTPTHRKHILEMKASDVEQMLEGIRSRRMRSYEEYKAKRAAIMSIRADKITSQVNKRLQAIEKQFTKADELMSKIEGDISKLRALELQLEDAIGE